MAKKSKSPAKAGKAKEEDDYFELDFSKVKNYFKRKKKLPEEKKVEKKEDEEDDFDFDLSSAKNWFLKNKKFTYPILTALLIIIACAFAWNVRTQSVANLQGKFLLGLDPYVFYRYASYIVDEGMPANDTLRHYPLGFDTSLELPSPSYAAAVVYWISNFFGNGITIMESTIIFPAIATIIGIIFFFLFAKQIFGSNKIAFVSSMILSVIPGFLFRTSAGFADKESVGMMFLFGMLYFISKYYKQEKLNGQIIFSILAGICLWGSALSWGGANLVFIPLGASFILAILLNISKRKDSMLYLALTLASFSVTFITQRFGEGIMALTNFMFLLFPVSLLLNLYYYELYPKISKFLAKYKPQNLPEHYYALIVGFALIFAISLFSPSIYERLFLFIESQLNPVGDAFSRSVSELQDSYFISSSGGDWWNSLNYVFFAMIIGSFFLFYDMLKKFPKQRVAFSIAYALITLGFIFSRFSDSLEYNDFNNFFQSRIMGIELHFFFLIVFFIYAAYFLIKNHKRLNDFSQIKMEYLFLFTWFFLTIVAARNAVRLIFIVCPTAAILSGYAFERLSNQLKKIIKSKEFSYLLIGIVFALIFFQNYNISYNSNKNFYSSFTYEWDEAMQWVRENTTSDSVFTHWWDYGYWVQGMGERATTLDGGNYYVNRNHLTGRYLFATRIYENGTYNMTEPATHLIHDFAKPDYFLLIDDDVLKFVQMGRIGKRPVFYTAGGFSENVENQWDIENSTIFPRILIFNSIYNYFPVQESIIHNNFIFAKDSTYILAIMFPFNSENSSMGAPYAYVYNEALPGNYALLPFNGQCFKEIGCETYRTDGLKEYPLLLNDGVVLITENATNNLFTHLYLLDLDVPGFEIAYDNERPLNVQGIVNSGLTDIKIYKINYSELEPWALDEPLPDYWSTPGDAFW